MSLIVFVIFWHPKVVSSKKTLVAQRTSNSWLSTSPDIVSTRLGERASGFRDPCICRLQMYGNFLHVGISGVFFSGGILNYMKV